VSAPPLSRIGDRLRERTAPLAPDDDAHGWAHAHLAAALATALDQVAEVFDPEDPVPPGAPILDVELCPDWALPWLAQIVGVSIPAGTDPDTARLWIRDVAGWRRGTPEALRAAAGLFLTGTRTVYFRERDPSGAIPAYTLEVVTLDDETPDPAAVNRALLAQKPAGIVLNYRRVTGWDYQAMTAEGGTYSTLAGTFSSYRDLTNNERT
jgi:hypothetical protein